MGMLARLFGKSPSPESDRTIAGSPSTYHAPSVQFTNWYISQETLQKDYTHRGFDGPGSEYFLRIEIIKQESILTSLLGDSFHNYMIYIHIKPSIFKNILSGTHLYAGLLRDTKLEDLQNVENFSTVVVGNCDDGRLLITPASKEGSDKFLASIFNCKDMSLIIYNQGGILANIPLPNDKQFMEIAENFFQIIDDES